MRTIETKVYTFNELSDRAKNYAIQHWIEEEEEQGDALYWFEETCNDIAKENGFWNCKFSWSLSHCQGDGLSFSGRIERDKLVEMYKNVLGTGKDKTAELLADNSSVFITGNTGRYCYASKHDIDMFIESLTSTTNTDMYNIEKVVNAVREDLENLYMDVCGKLEQMGYDEIDYYYSEEHVKEVLTINGYEFTEDGHMI